MALTQISTQGIKDGTITGTDLATNIDLVDSQKIRFGTGNDLQIYHDGSNSYIDDTGTGDLNISGSIVRLQDSNRLTYCRGVEGGAFEIYHNNALKFETTSYGAKWTGNLLGADNQQLQLGSSGDLQIYHDGTNSYIDNANTGILRIRGGSGGSGRDIQIQAKNGEYSINAIPDGAVELYFDNSKKFETISAGMKFTGELRGDDDNRIKLGDSQDLNLYHHSSHNSFLTNSTGFLALRSTDSIKLQSNTGEDMIKAVVDGGVELYHNNSKMFDTTTYGVKVTGRLAATTSITGADNVQIKLGDSDDLQIYHDGSDSFIKDTGVGAIRIDSNQTVLRNAAGTEHIIETTENGSVKLFFDGTQKCNTDSQGISIQGRIHTQIGTDFNTFNKTGTGKLVSLMTNGTERGNISSNGSTVQFNTSASDKSLKKNFENWTENTLTLFKNINAQKFNFLDQEDGTDKEKGFIAQDMVASFPEAYQKNDNDKYMFNPSGMVVYLMKAIQELEAEVASLKAS